MKVSARSIRMATDIQKHLPMAVQQVCSPNQVGLLTITAVEVSGDLRHADIFVSFLHKRVGAIKHLNTNSKRILNALTPLVHLNRSLRLRFKPDASQEHIESITPLLDNMK